jgi:hypothetical protein
VFTLQTASSKAARIQVTVVLCIAHPSIFLLKQPHFFHVKEAVNMEVPFISSIATANVFFIRHVRMIVVQHTQVVLHLANLPI